MTQQKTIHHSIFEAGCSELKLRLGLLHYAWMKVWNIYRAEPHICIILVDLILLCMHEVKTSSDNKRGYAMWRVFFKYIQTRRDDIQLDLTHLFCNFFLFQLQESDTRSQKVIQGVRLLWKTWRELFTLPVLWIMKRGNGYVFISYSNKSFIYFHQWNYNIYRDSGDFLLT